MNVSELAKELKTTDAAILAKLKGLHLKAKDGKQELSKATITVVRGEILKEMKASFKVGTDHSSRRHPAVEILQTESSKSEEKKAGTKKADAKKTDSKKTDTKKGKKEKGRDAESEKEHALQEKASKTAAVAKGKTTVMPVEPVAHSAEKGVPESKTVVVEEKPVVPPVASVEAPFTPIKPLLKKRRKSSAKTEGDRHQESAATTVTEATAKEDRPLSPGEASPGAPVSISREARNLPVLEVNIPISVKDLAVAMNRKPSIVLQQLIKMGIFATINQGLGEDVLQKLAQEFGYQIAKLKTPEERLIEEHKTKRDDPALLKPRAPVVTFMGHVDHGKTSLLDYIRKSAVAESEHGGITQHIGAYSVETQKGRITFLDTPGHEAFTAMRARGAHITDLVVLVVAADEGVMPQTDEAINHARAADAPILIALNKIDRHAADPDRVKKQLSERGLTAEDWGGKTIVVPVSAVTGEGVSQLLDMMLLEAEMLELKSNPDKPASGIVVEAHLSKGRGAVACLIVQSGTLHLNDIVVVGPHYGRVKAIFDDRERSLSEAGPSMPVEILGLPEVPEAGEEFYIVEDERQAKQVSESRAEQLKQEKFLSSRRITLEDLYSQIQQGKLRELNVILKADVQGSLEALKDSLEKIPSNEVKVKFIHTGVGDIGASDVILADASNAIIIGFHVSVGPKAEQELEKHPVDVRHYRIIYDAVNDVRKALEGLLEPKTKRIFLSRIEVRQVFKLSKSGTIAGCFVVKGKVTRKSKIDVIRSGKVVFSGTIGSLKRFKDDVREVGEGFECGIAVNGFDAYEPGDILETFNLETITRTL